MVFGIAVLYENIGFSIVFNLKCFKKKAFQCKVMKTLKLSSNCYIKISRSLKRRAILKIPITAFRGIYSLSATLKIKPLGISIFLC